MIKVCRLFIRRTNSMTERLSSVKDHFCTNMIQNNVNRLSSPDVGIIIIGDEILKGHVQDTNTHFLCRRLFSLGVKVKKVSVIPDDLDVIANEVSQFAKTYTHVITAGGIGPTHDDVTFQGVAQAFGEEVKPHPELVALCKEFFGTDDIHNPKLKLAFVPESAKLHYGIDPVTKEKHKYPLVAVNNVVVFPGIPKLMERAFNMLENLFRNPNAEFHVREMYVRADELSIAGVLNEVDARYKDRVILGSYPDWYNSYYKVKLTMEAPNVDSLDECADFIKSVLPADSIVPYEKDPISKADQRVYDMAQHGALSDNVRASIATVEECFDRYKPEEICVGFNGGKDCTALLHIVHAVYRRKYPDEFRKLKSLYIRRGQPFPEIELFIKKAKESYRLDLLIVNGKIKEALKEIKETYPELKAVLMGTRSTDPFSANLQPFSMTDPGWAEFMRVSPMLDWTYSDVWSFIRDLSLPYCPLYDRGYTSLGSMENTHPNPALQQVDTKGSVTYQPAFQLVDSQSERAGRN